MTTYVKDTIAARATPPGRGGIGVVRISGPAAPDIARQVAGALPEPRHAHLAEFRDEAGGPLDEGIVLFFPAPNSFTGEDVVELQGHGGPVVMDMLLARVVAAGARHAAPGEFSQRAFLNDRIDLAQAEAIADLIDSASAQAARGAMRSLQGEFSRRVDDLAERVTQLRIFVEAAIDFPEEEIDFLDDGRVLTQVAELRELLTQTLGEASQGALLREGASVVLAGKPNAGKSSLMNLLAGEEASIVTSTPGTTRDKVDRTIQLEGVPLRLTDTAGLRDTREAVEAEGVRRAADALAKADVALLVIDGSLPEPDRVAHLHELRAEVGNAIVLVNKIDLVSEPAVMLEGEFEGALALSCKRGDGVDALKAELLKRVGYDLGAAAGYSARPRHVAALEAAGRALAEGERALGTQGAGELLAEELKLAQQHLGEITGAVTADDLLGRIFQSFCIGK